MSTPTAAVRSRLAVGGVAVRPIGALLAISVAIIHVVDQGGIPGSKDPSYIGYLYWILEIAAVICAVLLLIPAVSGAGWVLALGVAAGPIVAYVLSRSTGLPNYTDDKGNWGETIGVISLIVEGLLLLFAIGSLIGGRNRVTAPSPALA